MAVKGYKTPGTIVAEIKMRRMLRRSAFLVLEGVDDVRFWKTRHHVDCVLIDAEGKPNVVHGIARLNASGMESILGVVDDDYDSMLGVSYDVHCNMAATDAHDLECLLCRSSALDSVLAEYGDDTKVTRFEEDTGTEVRRGLLERAVIFGRIRLFAAGRNPPVGLGTIRVAAFVDERTWEVDADRLLQVVVDTGVAAEDVADAIRALRSADSWRVANGHDMVDLLTIGLRYVLGNLSPTIGRNQLAAMLRVSMPAGEFRDTNLWRDIRHWESLNTGYSILREQQA